MMHSQDNVVKSLEGLLKTREDTVLYLMSQNIAKDAELKRCQQESLHAGPAHAKQWQQLALLHEKALEERDVKQAVALKERDDAILVAASNKERNGKEEDQEALHDAVAKAQKDTRRDYQARLDTMERQHQTDTENHNELQLQLGEMQEHHGLILAGLLTHAHEESRVSRRTTAQRLELLRSDFATKEAGMLTSKKMVEERLVLANNELARVEAARVRERNELVSQHAKTLSTKDDFTDKLREAMQSTIDAKSAELSDAEYVAKKQTEIARLESSMKEDEEKSARERRELVQHRVVLSLHNKNKDAQKVCKEMQSSMDATLAELESVKESLEQAVHTLSKKRSTIARLKSRVNTLEENFAQEQEEHAEALTTKGDFTENLREEMQTTIDAKTARLQAYEVSFKETVENLVMEHAARMKAEFESAYETKFETETMDIVQSLDAGCIKLMATLNSGVKELREEMRAPNKQKREKVEPASTPSSKRLKLFESPQTENV